MRPSVRRVDARGSQAKRPVAIWKKLSFAGYLILLIETTVDFAEKKENGPNCAVMHNSAGPVAPLAVRSLDGTPRSTE
jgi:hypothetical protein